MSKNTIANDRKDPDDLLKELSQDIYLVKHSGDIINIPYQTYRSAPILTWDNTSHGYFTTADGAQPLNLVGPVLTKVLQWNIDNCGQFSTENTPYGSNGEPLVLKPGYLLDLRGLHLTRLRSVLKQLGSYLTGHINAEQHSPFINIPEQDAYQLSEIPAGENLYIISWQDPFDFHDESKQPASQMNYLTYQQLGTDLAMKQPIQPEVTHYIQSYFINAGVQIGTLNPLDTIETPNTAQPTTKPNAADLASENAFYVTCYIANLKSFMK